MRTVTILLLAVTITALPTLAIAQTTTIVQEPLIGSQQPIGQAQPVPAAPPGQPLLPSGAATPQTYYIVPQNQLTPQQQQQFRNSLTQPIFERSWPTIHEQVEVQPYGTPPPGQDQQAGQ